MPSGHIVHSFDTELNYLAQKIVEMGRHAGTMVEQAVRAVVTDDNDLAKAVIAADPILDRAEREIDEKAILVIARRQPMAVDLREIVGAIRISADLERVGDLGKNIAKRTAAIAQTRNPGVLYGSLEIFASLALTQLSRVLEGYEKRSLKQIQSVREHDDEIDAMYTTIFREFLTYMMEDPRNITPCTHLLFCAKNIERIGDHATSIAETAAYIMTGAYPASGRPKGDKTYHIGISKPKKKSNVK